MQIEDAGYYNEPNVRRAKKVKETGSDVSEPLTILLDTGEAIDLPVEVREDGMPDMLTIANFIQQRSTIYKTEQRRTQKT